METAYHIFRIITACVLFLFGASLILLNWHYVFTSIKRRSLQHGSFYPIIGGYFAGLGLDWFPSSLTQQFSYLPVLADPGCWLFVIVWLPMLLVRRFRSISKRE